MRKSLLCLALTAAVTGSAFMGYEVLRFHNCNAMSDLLLENIDALSDDEIVKIPCDPSDQICFIQVMSPNGTVGVAEIKNAKHIY